MRTPPQPLSAPRLGDLEVAVLEYLWSTPDGSVRDVHEAIGRSRGISLNTVQSTLERLFRKDLLDRRKQGHAYHYRARVGRDELVAGLINDILGRFGSDAVSAIAAFVDAAGPVDEAALEAIERELQQRRQRSKP